MDFLDVRPAYEWLKILDAIPYHLTVDAVFVLGSGSEGPVRHASLIARKFTFPNPPVVFTSVGGTFGGNLVFGCTEIRHYRTLLEEAGVPQNTIWHPNEARGTINTLEEARNAITFIKQRSGASPLRVILCSRPVHQRRAWLTFRKQNQEVAFFNAPCEELLSAELLPRILGEIVRIREYGKKGDIEECEIPSNILQIEKRLLELGIKAL